MHPTFHPTSKLFDVGCICAGLQSPGRPRGGSRNFITPKMKLFVIIDIIKHV